MDRADRGVGHATSPTVSLYISSEGSLPGARSRPRSRACLTCYSRDILTCTSPNQEAQATRATTGREHHSSPLPHFPDRQLSAGDGAAEPGRRQRLHLTRARGHDSIGHSSSSIWPPLRRRITRVAISSSAGDNAISNLTGGSGDACSIWLRPAKFARERARHRDAPSDRI